MDQKSDGQAILTSVDNQIRFETFVTPEQVGELLLALVILREQVREDKEIGEEVGEAVLESVLLS